MNPVSRQLEVIRFLKLDVTFTAPASASVMAGKLKLVATGVHLDLLDTYTLFGDPALTMYLTVTPVNYTDTSYLPLILH